MKQINLHFERNISNEIVQAICRKYFAQISCDCTLYSDKNNALIKGEFVMNAKKNTMHMIVPKFFLADVGRTYRCELTKFPDEFIGTEFIDKGLKLSLNNCKIASDFIFSTDNIDNETGFEMWFEIKPSLEDGGIIFELTN